MAPERTCVACYGTIPDGAQWCPHCGAGKPAEARERGDVERGCLMGFGAFVVLPIALASIGAFACAVFVGVGSTARRAEKAQASRAISSRRAASESGDIGASRAEGGASALRTWGEAAFVRVDVERLEEGPAGVWTIEAKVANVSRVLDARFAGEQDIWPAMRAYDARGSELMALQSSLNATSARTGEILYRGGGFLVAKRRFESEAGMKPVRLEVDCALLGRSGTVVVSLGD